MVPPNHLEKHAPSSEILRCAARCVISSKPFRAVTREDEDCGSAAEKKTLMINLDKVKKIWRAVALVIDNSLISASRGVRIESLGTFTLDGKGRAQFFLASDFASRHRLLKYDVCAGGCLAGGSVNTKLNITRVAATAGSPRPDVERVVDAVLRSLRQCLAAGRSVSLLFHPVAEFFCVPGGQAGMRYLTAFRARQKAAGAAATRARVGVGRLTTKPTPWAATAYSHAWDTTSDTTQAGKGKWAQRPHSASLSTTKECLFVTNRPQTSHDKIDETIAAGNKQKSAVSDVDVEKEERGERETPRSGVCGYSDDARHQTPNPPSSCVSPGAPVFRNPLESNEKHCGFGKSDGNSATKVNPPARRGRRSIRNSKELGAHPEMDIERLADLLRRQALVQVGHEGLRRLTETIKLMHVGSRSSSGGELSGRDLLQVLRDTGTRLTSRQLADITGLFGRQPNGYISLKAFLVAMEPDSCPIRPVEAAAARAPSGRLSELEETKCRLVGSPFHHPSNRGSQPRVVSPKSDLSKTSGRSDSGRRYAALTSSPGKSQTEKEPVVKLESRTVEKNGLHGCRTEFEEQRRCDGSQQYHQMRPLDKEGHSDTFYTAGFATEKELMSQKASPVMLHAHRECRGEVADKVRDRAGMVIGERDPIVDLAEVMYSPPCSLEGLIHVLQASKVREWPRVCAAVRESKTL